MDGSHEPIKESLRRYPNPAIIRYCRSTWSCPHHKLKQFLSLVRALTCPQMESWPSWYSMGWSTYQANYEGTLLLPRQRIRRLVRVSYKSDRPLPKKF